MAGGYRRRHTVFNSSNWSGRLELPRLISERLFARVRCIAKWIWLLFRVCSTTIGYLAEREGSAPCWQETQSCRTTVNKDLCTLMRPS